MKKILALLLCAAFTACLAGCNSNNPTPLESTDKVWDNPSEASLPAEITFTQAKTLVDEVVAALKEQEKNVDAAQVEKAANLIVSIRVFRGNTTDEGRYLQAVGDAYERVYGFYLKNSSDAQLEQALEEMDKTQKSISKLLQTSFKPISHELFQKAAAQFNQYGDTVIAQDDED